jgi:hypothetical protein
MLQPYNKNATFIWCQEEPLNMGAWAYVSPRLEIVWIITFPTCDVTSLRSWRDLAWAIISSSSEDDVLMHHQQQVTLALRAFLITARCRIHSTSPEGIDCYLGWNNYEVIDGVDSQQTRLSTWNAQIILLSRNKTFYLYLQENIHVCMWKTRRWAIYAVELGERRANGWKACICRYENGILDRL